MRVPIVRANHIDQVLIYLPFFKQANFAKNQSLLDSLFGQMGTSAFGHTADIVPVSLVGKPEYNFIAREDRKKNIHVIEVSDPTTVRVIRQKDIAWLDILSAEFLKHGSNPLIKGSDEDRYPGARACEVTFRVGNPDAVIEDFI